MTLPTIAVTMGDAAGIGPEIIVSACTEPEVLNRCRPIIIGDAARLQAAAEIIGRTDLTFQTFTDPTRQA